MNTKTLLIATLIGGVTSTLLANVPFVSLVNCLLCAGFWGSAVLAVWLYKRLEGSVTMAQGLGIGALAGVWAGLLGFLLSFVGLTGAAGLLNSFGPFLPAAALPDLGRDVPAWSAMAFTLTGVVVDVAFGAIGGLIGGALFKNTPKPAGVS
jgi:hypothetical protein